MFEGPRLHVLIAGLHEFASQPVEEFGMRWRAALGAKIVFGFNDAFAEVALPDAVGEDAGGEWVFGIDNPFGEVQTGEFRGRLLALTLTQF